MTDVDIEYCVPCGLRKHAVETQQRPLEEFGRDVDGVRLQPGRSGVFRVRADDELIWDRDDHGGEIDLDAITEAVHERSRAHA